MTETLGAPQPLRDLLADAAGQSPLVTHWLAGWLAGQGIEAASVRLVISAASVEVTRNPEAPETAD